jgi:leucyl-tRNA synthetase
MSKSKKNVVDPALLVDTMAQITVRMFCLFASRLNVTLNGAIRVWKGHTDF